MSKRFRFSPYLAALSAVVAVFAAVLILDRWEQQRFQQENRAEVLNRLSAIRATLEGELNQRLYLTRGLVAYISAVNPNITQAEFEKLARVMVAQQPGIPSAALFRNSITTHLYPLAGQEKALGFEPMKVPEERLAFEKAIKTRRTVLAGPVELVAMGDMAFITRTPIFLTPKGAAPESGPYWGMVSIGILREPMLKEAGLLDANSHLQYAIRGKDGLGAAGEVFFGNAAIFQQHPVILDVTLPNGSWQLAAVPAGGWPSGAGGSKKLWMGGGLLALLAGLFAFKWARDPQRLREAVEQATQAFKESEANYRELVQNANSIILKIDPRGNITFFNEFAQNFFGYSEAEIVGKSPMGTILPETDTSGNDLAAMLDELIKSPEQYICNENENMRRNGERVWIAWRNKILRDEAGGFAGMLCIGTDISDRKRAEEALQKANEELEIRVEERTAELSQANEKLLEEIRDRQQAEEEFRQSEERWQLALKGNNDGIWDLNLKTNEVFYSARYKEIIGYEDGEIPNKYEEWYSRLHPDDISRVEEDFQKHISLQTPHYVSEHRLRAKDGSYKWILSRGQALWDEEGKAARVVGSITDITERKMAEEALLQSEAREREKAQQLEETLRELQRTQAQLIQTEKMSSLGQLVAGIAHEINNPINFIHGNLTHANNYTKDLLDLIKLFLEEYPVPIPKIQDHIDKIELDFLEEDIIKIMSSMKAGTERIRSIVLSLRNFSRLDESDLKEVDIHEGIESTLLILQNRLKGENGQPEIRVVKEFGTLPLVECYAGQMNQVFLNVLSNAIDAVRQGGCSQSQEAIAIRTCFLEPDIVRVEIADKGCGMSEAVKARIFEPFFTTKDVGQGTGLGLSVSYQIVVEKHGGAIACFSEPGKGTTFQIEIPIQQSNPKISPS